MQITETAINWTYWSLLTHKGVVYSLSIAGISFRSLVEITGSPVQLIELTVLCTGLANPNLACLIIDLGF